MKECDLCQGEVDESAAMLTLTAIDGTARELILCNDCTERLVKWLNANRVVRI